MGLTDAQHARLDQLADFDTDAKVVGLDGEEPVVEFKDGSLAMVGNGGTVRKTVAMATVAQRTMR